MAKVAFLGLGVMGYPMAGHLKVKGGDGIRHRQALGLGFTTAMAVRILGLDSVAGAVLHIVTAR